MKPMKYDALLRKRGFSAVLVSSVGPTVVSKASENPSSAIYTSVQEKNQ